MTREQANKEAKRMDKEEGRNRIKGKNRRNMGNRWT